LGASRQIEWVDVRWPSGRHEQFDNLEADNGYRL